MNKEQEGRTDMFFHQNKKVENENGEKRKENTFWNEARRIFFL